MQKVDGFWIDPIFENSKRIIFVQLSLISFV
jgi:hypothetical protein